MACHKDCCVRMPARCISGELSTLVSISSINSVVIKTITKKKGDLSCNIFFVFFFSLYI